MAFFVISIGREFKGPQSATTAWNEVRPLARRQCRQSQGEGWRKIRKIRQGELSGFEMCHMSSVCAGAEHL